MKRRTAILLLATLSFAATARSAGEADRLRALFDREWEVRLEEDPLFATSVGRHEWNDRLPSMRPRDLERRRDLWQGMLDELAAIDSGQLAPADRINAEIFRRQLESRVLDHRFGGYRLPINSDSGFHTDVARLAEEVPLATTGDYERYIARMRAMPRYFGEQIELMRQGLETGMTLPRVTLEGYEVTIASHVVDEIERSVFWAPFAKLPPTVPASEHDRLRAAGAAAIRDGAVAAYRAFLRFMVDEYLPATRTTLGASELPDGRDYYRYRIRHFTTLDLSPEEIHRIGRAEVERIRAEMEEVISQVGFDGGFSEFLTFLRTDPRFYAETPEELLKEAAWIAKRMDAKLPALFKTLPRLPYGVEPVPDHLAPKYTTGRYVGAPLGSTQPGFYWVNTYDLKSRPLYNLEALTLHEAVPGHHLQIALNRELEALPNFRRFSYISAFGEGWGLYSEYLGVEAGFYGDPYSNFGRLTYEMWRACRLVVDTGLHAMGWTRQQAMDLLAANTALPLHEIKTETDRYISWPAQALAYKLGELKIKELRRRAEETLGERFDVRAFHDAVLANGSVPLPVLEQSIERFIAEAAAADG
jgi:uncharacterized protein (DUF885 family)